MDNPSTLGEHIDQTIMEGCVFREFLLKDVPTLTDEELDLCVTDLVSMGEEDFVDEAIAYRVWVSRLGGLVNIPAYVRVLESSERWKR